MNLINKTSVLFALLLLLLTACADWNSEPLRLDAQFGTSTREIMHAQILNPNAGTENDNVYPQTLDGQAGEQTMQAYRQNAQNEGEVQPVTINIGK